jgi:hypothetical protein
MRFDSARAMKVIDELGDPRFAGPDGEARVADYVAEQFAAMGWQVERLAVVGSRPHLLAAWTRWLGYGLLITSAYVLIILDRLVASAGAVLLLLYGRILFGDLVGSSIRTARRRPPSGSAPVVVASLPRRSPAPVRVVFQASLGELRPSLFHVILRDKYHDLFWINRLLFACMMFALLLGLGMWYRPGREFSRLGHEVFLRYLIPPILAFNWMVILGVLAWEYHQFRSRGRPGAPERRGLAVLLELARSWPRGQSRPIEPLFVAAGGPQLDHAGTREIARRFACGGTSRPSLRILLLAPGAGEALWLATRDPPLPVVRGTGAMVRDAAQSLWIPSKVVHHSTPLPFWPIADWGPVVALMGSDPRAYPDASADPQALHRAAQLATEIALRWARRQQPPAGAAADPTT